MDLITYKTRREDARFVTPGHPIPSPRPSSSGFTYLALLTAIIILGIMSTAVGKYWANVSHREKEEELLFRGDQYRNAIESYTKAYYTFPPTLDVLLKDPRGKRFLRRKYKDPISGENFTEVRDQYMHIIGVHSPSDKEPIKKANFPEQDKDFEGKDKYSDWVFVYVMPAQAPGIGTGTGVDIRRRLYIPPTPVPPGGRIGGGG